MNSQEGCEMMRESVAISRYKGVAVASVLGVAKKVEDLVDILLSDFCEAQENTCSVSNGRALPWGDLENAGIVIGMATEGEFSSPDLNASVKDADSTMDEDIV